MTTQEEANAELQKWWNERAERERIAIWRHRLADLSRRLQDMRELYIEGEVSL
jgi:hypothetical protein